MKKQTVVILIAVAFVAYLIYLFITINPFPKEEYKFGDRDTYRRAVAQYDKGDLLTAITLLSIIKDDSLYMDSANYLTALIYEKQNQQLQSKAAVNAPVKSEKSFTLTHMSGKRLPQKASFEVDGSIWKLDYNNGDVINYTPITFNKHNALCGIKATDDHGDGCTICITKTDGDGAIITFDYSGSVLTYKGYFNR